MTGRPEHESYLRSLGAARTIGRGDYAVACKPGRHGMMFELFASVIDTVGGPVLSSAIARLASGGYVAVCGLVVGPNLKPLCFPFCCARSTSLASIRCAVPRRDASKRGSGFRNACQAHSSTA
ncbi:hypothetical protein [Paraburkholderia nodosa]|uniref:hypothetical protein n=1 Tax=Paraburkholderia nodosa TaxID=392320 RepID=UPI00210D4A94|nr:hypothetical protein [Paraburkholderia nodosa]